jgi:peptide/nickel transport system substrate-binding protein
VTVQWQGVPGYFPQSFEGHFFHPLPRHAWSILSAEDLLNADLSTTTPLGWGPYVIQEWTRGDHITLVKNPNYFRAAEGLPEFDVLVYRFLGETSDSNLEALLIGECDIVDQTTLLDDQLGKLIELQGERQLFAYIGVGPEVEQLVLGIRPASYDDGYNAATDRPDFFGDVRVRQAIAYCLDRPSLVAALRSAQGGVAAGLVPPQSPFYPTDLAALPYDPAEGARLLDEVGWKDADNNPASPRVAQNVPNVPNGTSFVINYYTSQATLRMKVADLLVESLAGCGIQANLTSYNINDLYAAGPEGPLFGRQFDLVQFSWGASRFPPCSLYETGQIPSANNSWLGGNMPGCPHRPPGCGGGNCAVVSTSAAFVCRAASIHSLVL